MKIAMAPYMKGPFGVLIHQIGLRRNGLHCRPPKGLPPGFTAQAYMDRSHKMPVSPVLLYWGNTPHPPLQSPPLATPPPPTLGGDRHFGNRLFPLCSLILLMLVPPIRVDSSLHQDTNVCQRRSCLAPLLQQGWPTVSNCHWSLAL